uniref:Uncharacterized protein n=1 Tax=Setaria italica TaxID=4555 RepID=K3YWM9_SETIT
MARSTSRVTSRGASMARSTSRVTSRGRRGHRATPVIGSPQGAPELDSANDFDDTTNSEDDDPTYSQEEVGPSQLQGASTPTQGSPPPKREAWGRDRTDAGSVNVPPLPPTRAVIVRRRSHTLRIDHVLVAKLIV